MRESEDFPTYVELTQTSAWTRDAGATIAARLSSESDTTRYSERAVLGTGGMGKVVLARDARIGRDVAVKVLHADRKHTGAARARFLREAQVQGQLEHPSIVPVYDVANAEDGSTFFTMRRVLGKTLAAILEDIRAGATNVRTRRELLQAFATVCLAVDYAHSRGVIHRDLKPANIMLGEFGEVYVLDWGVARVVDVSSVSGEHTASRLSPPGITIGTPLYMAPEQVADSEVGPAADVFSLGAILFEILALEPLRTAKSLYEPVDAQLSTRVPDADIAPELETICVRATRFESTDRYPTARALQEAVARYLEGDRALEHRRSLAREHAARARIALASDTPQDDVAMLELARALALDPTNIEHVSMMAEVLRAPVKTTPPAIQDIIEASNQDTLRAGARYASASMATWFAFLPLVFWLGIERYDYLAGVLVPLIAATGFGLLSMRRERISIRLQICTLASVQLASMMMSRMFGPLMLMPCLFAGSAMFIQAHPDRGLRYFGLVSWAIGMALPVALELAGVIPASYTSDHGFAIVPQMTSLPYAPTILFVCAASIAAVIVPSIFVARLREQLADSQRRELLQTWRLRRLGENMLQVVY